MEAPAFDLNSTNVRNAAAARSLFGFVILWFAAVIGGTGAGVFGALAPEEVAALAIFATLFATASYFLDEEIHSWFLTVDTRNVRLGAFVSEALVIGGLVALSAEDWSWSALAGFPFAPWLLFGVPLALALHAALADRAWRSGGLSSPRAQAPVVRRAAS